jgi:hypothetical protein
MPVGKLQTLIRIVRIELHQGLYDSQVPPETRLCQFQVSLAPVGVTDPEVNLTQPRLPQLILGLLRH